MTDTGDIKSVTTGRRRSEDYAALKGVLDEAYTQSAEGKGRARHANDRPFEQQPILQIGRMVGPGFATGQIMKKAQEATGMASRGEGRAAVAELLGAIVYAASAVVLIRESELALQGEVLEHVATPATTEFKIGDRVQVVGLTDGNPGRIIGEENGLFAINWDHGPHVGAACWSPTELIHETA